MVDANESHILFGQPGQNKGDYINILVNSYEFKEGLIRWAYKTFMARDATSAEVNELIQDLNTTLDFPRMQKEILKTDEYANF
jgi:ABC-type sugar transport system ATPase subunit